MSNENGRGRGGKKRYNSQPMGGANKDSRSEDLMDDDLSWATVVNGRQTAPTPTPVSNAFSLLNQPNSFPDKTMRSDSISSRTSARGSTRGGGRGSFRTQQQLRQHQQSQQQRPQRQSDLGDNTRFTTPGSEGPLRDEIVVECQKLNDRPFKGTITFNEAVDSIFTEIMGFQFADLYSVRMRFSGCPTVRFKLKTQTNVDDLIGVEFFNLERRAPGSNNVDYISCKILGIRGMQSVPHYDGSENDVRWIKVEGCEYQLTEDEIKQGLAPYGELLTPIREDIHDDSDSERDKIGNGTYSVKMKLTRQIPQFLPMHSRRIRIYYSGINKLCTNCYGRHTRRQCRNQKRPWIEYVRDFMFENDELPEEYYGKWWDIVDNEFPGYFEVAPQTTSDENQTDSSNTRFAEQRKDPPYLSRDPRLNRKRDQQPQQQQQQHQLQQQPQPNSFRPTQTPQSDRQLEMTSLLATGLTLTDARKYLNNKAEQEEIERRMSRPGSSRSQTNDGNPRVLAGHRGGHNGAQK